MASDDAKCSYCELSDGHLGDCPVPRDMLIADLKSQLLVAQKQIEELKAKMKSDFFGPLDFSQAQGGA